MFDDFDEDAPTLAPGNSQAVLANRYKIVRPLGRGGMGSVWLAEDVQLDGKPVAIKMLPSVLVANKRAYLQLKREALVAMKLVHQNIVALRSFEENAGNPFLVMDYIEGRTLDDILAEKGALSAAETARILGPAADALDYAHSKGVVHRDVKPGNVMVSPGGDVFVLDFGIAREVEESITMATGAVASGTPSYMSPEQMHGANPSPAQDVYSFAALAYECLAGKPPFSGGQIEYRIDNDAPPPLPSSREALFREISAGIAAGLSKDPSARPANCKAVLSARAAASPERPRDVEAAPSPARGTLAFPPGASPSFAAQTIIVMQPSQKENIRAETPVRPDAKPDIRKSKAGYRIAAVVLLALAALGAALAKLSFSSAARVVESAIGDLTERSRSAQPQAGGQRTDPADSTIHVNGRPARPPARLIRSPAQDSP